MSRARLLVAGVAVAAAYVITARLGFRASMVAEQVTTVWAPTGIAIAALLLGGIRMWPAIWAGAFFANVGTSAPLWTAPLIASGNTLEAVAAVWMLRALPDFDLRLCRVSHTTLFLAAAALASLVSATAGVSALCAAAVQPWTAFSTLWFDWWLGDVLGAIIVAPVIVTAAHRWSRAEARQTALFVGVAVLLTHVVFGQLLGATAHPLEYAVFPVVIAAAVRGGPSLSSWTVLSASAVAIWHTIRRTGPFAGPSVHESLVELQVFMGVLAATALMLAAAVAEREASERRERAAGQTLKRREEMLTLAQKAGGVATFEWDFARQVAHCSAEFFRIFGLPFRDGVISSQEWGQYLHPDDRERMAAHLTRAIGGEEPAAADYRIVAADGRTRWLSYAGEVQRRPDGLRLLGTVVDITDRKRLEAELRHHADEVERILESIGEGFVTLDRECRYVYVNRSAEVMLGRPRSELLGHTPWEVFPADTIGEPRRRIEEAMRSGQTAEFDVHIGGEWNRWFENRMYPSPEGISIFFADITARVQSQAQLRESRDVLALAMRGGGMGAWSRNLATNEVWWSRELEELLGLDPGGFAGTEAGFFEFVHEDDRAAVREAVDAAVRGRTDYVTEFRVRHADGSWRWMEGRGRAVYGDDGSPRTLYGIGMDVTARKQAEIALREAKSAAESANQLKDQFLATLSHELRTPLTAILGYAQMLRTNAISPGKRENAIEVIERNAMALAGLVEDLLDMSRITTGRLRLDVEPIPVAHLLREAAEAVRPAADAKGIVLEVTAEPASGMVTADANRLRQVFWNLLSNAVKFTGPQGRVTAAVARDGEHIDVTVRDNGAGIPPDFLPFVFEPFRQADARSSRTHGGLGLGLAISRQLVELHGGTMSASSGGPDQGATFTVRLPRAAGPTNVYAAGDEPSTM